MLWHSLTSDNLGVTALSVSNIQVARNAARRAGIDAEFVIIGTCGSMPHPVNTNDCEAHGCWSLRQLLSHPWKFSALIKSCDLVLDIGEGDSFSDIYGSRRYFAQALSKAMVIAGRRPLILCPQTIGPFSSSLSRLSSALLMQMCVKVFARDSLSMECLHSLGVAKVAGEAIDVAFCLPFDRADWPSVDRLDVGINVSALLYNGGYTRGNQFQLVAKYDALVHALISYFLNVPGVIVHLIPHVFARDAGVEDDHALALRLAERYPGVVVPKAFCSPSEAKSYIAGMEFFVGSRMHACIAAFSSGIPVVPLAYSRKFAGLFKTLDYEYVGDCRTDSNTTLLKLVLDSFDQRESLKAEVDKGNRRARARLRDYEDFLTERVCALSQARQ